MVKREDFKACDQSGFCRRQQAYASIADTSTSPSFTSPYELIPSSVQVDHGAGTLKADVVDTERNVPYVLHVSLLKDATARVKFGEANPLYPRFDMLDALTRTGIQDVPISIANYTKSTSATSPLRIQLGGTPNNLEVLLVIQPKPFKFEFLIDGDPVMAFNGRGYLYYEHSRKKEDDANPPAVVDQTGGETAATPSDLDKLKEELKRDLWEETYKTFVDSKPHGPQSIGFDVSFPGSSHVYGLSEHGSSFNLKSTRGEGASYSEPYRLYNLDVFEYELDDPMSLYGAVPLMIAHKKGRSVGMYWQNSAEMWIDIERSGKGVLSNLASYIPFSSTSSNVQTTTTHWMAESGQLDVFFFLGPDTKSVLRQYATITGFAPMPQSFAIGYHQCRWNYNDQRDVLEVDANFDKYDIPYDVIWLDIEHTDGKKYFTWDKAKFPTPLEMQKSLAVTSRKLVTIVDPHLKKDDSYHILKEAQDRDILVKSKDNVNYEGWCWPGNSAWIDYVNPAGRAYWASKFAFDQYEGTSETLYTWNDMNEPSVFNGPEVTMHKDVLHYNGWEHRDIHNAYGMLMVGATFEGQMKRTNGRLRAFVLSRAFFGGSQKYGAIWTGDNDASWEHLAASVPMLLSAGISGMAFAGADVGGFFRNPEVDLLERWYQIGAFQPFFRAHAHIDTKRREPWLFGDVVTGRIREVIRSRYRLLPFWYTLFQEWTITNLPPMRPMMLGYPDDEASFGIDDQFMLGDSLVVKGIYTKDAKSVDVYLPKQDVWYDYFTFTKVTPTSQSRYVAPTVLEHIPVFIRGGSIIPRRDRVRRSSSLMKRDPFTLVIALDEKASADFGEATGSLYLDDGETFAFQKGEFIHTTFTFGHNTLTAVVSPKSAAALRSSSNAGASGVFEARVERLILVGVGKDKMKSARINGKELGVTVEKHVYASSWKIVVKDPGAEGAVIGKSWSVEFS
ncbi:hypothetical protein SmJEL517_g04192 [Synchytrium microbalum]|uniref:Glucosidase II subunit alpha n=1 Tax=Synchytrium microbalum TaxID=1806994 RepID=A0A507C5J3_9FUNG|nr:uncharacterized protein SmJEL517_g04192 [Synchytrium microbalum]TPX32725.1 hypothetical protein SmJEL517_g04192 [Synchytrium microbalum]